tara:strand:- start:41 stop:511 length:471 start_codon:yes stop_codon:yes gene_type:complete
MKKVLLGMVVSVILMSCGENGSKSKVKDKDTSEVTKVSFKYQNPNLVSVLVASKKRKNSEFKFMSKTIISTNILVSSKDTEDESMLAKIIDNDLKINGRYDVNTLQTFDKNDNSKLLYESMTARYKGFDYVLDFRGTTNENVYKLNIENGETYSLK